MTRTQNLPPLLSFKTAHARSKPHCWVSPASHCVPRPLRAVDGRHPGRFWRWVLKGVIASIILYQTATDRYLASTEIQPNII